jgi:xanthine dehydrogenase YagS FAD-binding subunit
MTFEFTSPRTLDEALRLWQPDARWFAGGTDLVPEIKSELTAPTRLINLKTIPDLNGIAETERGLRLGGLATLTELGAHPGIRQHYPALAESCRLAASPQLRNIATIGGNLNQDSRCAYYRGEFNCWLKGGAVCYMREGENREAAIFGYHDCVHVHPSDPANALIAFDATLTLRSANGSRELSVGDFFRAPAGDNRRLNDRRPDEIITEILLPKFSNSRSVYLKEMDRAAWGFALVSVAVRLDFDGEKISDARIVLGGVAPTPWRVPDAERLLVGQTLSPDLAARAAEAAIQNAQPLAHNAYKIRLAKALVKRAILNKTDAV